MIQFNELALSEDKKKIKIDCEATGQSEYIKSVKLVYHRNTNSADIMQSEGQASKPVRTKYTFRLDIVRSITDVCPEDTIQFIPCQFGIETRSNSDKTFLNTVPETIIRRMKIAILV